MTEMMPRQRWLATIRREPVDRIPCDYWSTGEFHAKLRAQTGCPDDNALWLTLGIDRPRWVGPKLLSKRNADPQADIWGIRYRNISYGTGEYAETAHNPLAQISTLRQADDHPWPSADDYDYSIVRQALASDDGYRPIQGAGFEPFLLYCSLRGMEQAYLDLLENEDLAQCILGHIFDFFFELNRRIFQAGGGKVDLLYLAEDLGSQHGPLFSLEMYRRYLLPRQKAMADLARQYGVHVFYHTDGAARQFLPDLVEVVGIEILNPLQWRCPGMELPELVRDFGSRIAFHGGIDNQQTLPFGTPDDVRREVAWVAGIMRQARASWICAPCHNIQAVSPVANVLAMYEAAHQVR
jgi:uroporphyrinogen decarboxylase